MAINFKAKGKRILDARTLWIALLIPLILLPLPLISPSQVSKCGYCVLLIGIYWVTEVIPLAVTSLLPIFLFPVFGIMSAKETCSSYAKDTLMLFMGSLVVAVAVERWNLHRRVALRTLCLVGPQPKWLMFGIMFPCWFLSMWMSNTATSAMMMPIVNAIIEQIRLSKHEGDPEESAIILQNQVAGDVADTDMNDDHTEKVQIEDGKTTMGGILTLGERLKAEGDEEFIRLAKTFSLCIAFSANVGGMATLTGTPPNIIFKGQADIMFEKAGGSGVNFANWLAVGIPVAVILFLLTWAWLYVYTVRGKALKCCGDKESYDAVRNVIHKEASQLGTMTFPEVIVLINFILLALLWVTRQPGFIPGWGSLLKEGYSGDSTPAILIGVVLFILPSRPLRWICRAEDPNAPAGYQPILNWTIVNERMAWGVLLLMGGGFAVADACQRSGLSQWVSSNLLALSSLDPWIIALVLSILISLATQVTSNAATATLFLPIVGNMAVNMGIHPLYFMVPCTLATSLAFILPVATPPNAIVFASGYLEVKDMVKAGIPINIISLVVVNIALNAWFVPFYKMDGLPSIFHSNSTVGPGIASALMLNSTATP